MSRRLPPPPAVPAEAREVAETWRPVCPVCGTLDGRGFPMCPRHSGGRQPSPRDLIPDDELDRIFGACESVDPGPLLEELGSLRADLRTIERVYWSDDEGGRDE